MSRHRLLQLAFPCLLRARAVMRVRVCRWRDVLGARLHRWLVWSAPELRHLDDAECGLACLLIVLRHHGNWRTLAECREECEIGRDGLSAMRLAEVARRYGFHVQSWIAPNLDVLGCCPLPLIAHCGRSRFIVVSAISSSGVSTIDPARGRCWIRRRDFLDLFSGLALTLEPGPCFERRARPPLWPSLLRLLSTTFLEGSRSDDSAPRREPLCRLNVVAAFVALSLALQCLALAAPWFVFVTFDYVVPLGSWHLLSWLLPGVCFVVVAECCLRLARGRLLARLRCALEEDLVNRLVRRMMTMPAGRFRGRPVAECVERVEGGLLACSSVERAVVVLVDGLLGFLLLVAAACWSWRLALVGLCLAGVLLLAFLPGVSWLSACVRKRRRVEKHAQSSLSSLLGGMVTARASGVEMAMVNDWGPLLRARVEVFDEQERVAGVLRVAHGGLRLVVLGVCLAASAGEVLAGRLGVGGAVAVGLLLSLMFERVAALSPVVCGWPEEWMRLQRLHDLLSEARNVSPPLTLPASSSSCALVFDRVRFRYDRGSPWVIKDLTWRFESGGIDDGRVVAVVGAGKSTFARLVAGLFVASDGEITYGNVPLSRLECGELARRCAVVLEESLLFAGSVANNVRFARAWVGEDEVVEACRVVEVHREVMEMPLEYDTPVFDAGVGLSGGQRHRLLLARALAGRPSLLVIDDVLTKLDVGSARRILARVRGRVALTVVLGDWLAAVRYADEIVVLGEGRVVERGMHAELIRAGGIYAGMACEQSVGLDDRVG